MLTAAAFLGIRIHYKMGTAVSFYNLNKISQQNFFNIFKYCLPPPNLTKLISFVQINFRQQRVLITMLREKRIRD